MSQQLKVVLLGEGNCSEPQFQISSYNVLGRVGKTSILLRFCRNVYHDGQASIVPVPYSKKRMTVDGQVCSIALGYFR